MQTWAVTRPRGRSISNRPPRAEMRQPIHHTLSSRCLEFQWLSFSWQSSQLSLKDLRENLVQTQHNVFEMLNMESTSKKSASVQLPNSCWLLLYQFSDRLQKRGKEKLPPNTLNLTHLRPQVPFGKRKQDGGENRALLRWHTGPLVTLITVSSPESLSL